MRAVVLLGQHQHQLAQELTSGPEEVLQRCLLWILSFGARQFDERHQRHPKVMLSM